MNLKELYNPLQTKMQKNTDVEYAPAIKIRLHKKKLALGNNANLLQWYGNKFISMAVIIV